MKYCIGDYLCAYLLLILFTLGKSGVQSDDSHWYYPADENWPETCQEGKKQSPIDISDKIATRITEPFSEMKLVNYDNKIKASITNDGHVVMITIDPRDDLYVIGGGLRGKYSLLQMHFHWKSEHTLNGRRIPLEGHFVHINRNSDLYRSKRDTSISDSDDLQVLAVFYMLSLENNTAISNVIEKIYQVSAMGTTNSIEFVPRLLLPKNVGQFYRYEGSLTTPPCYENVQWTVFPSMVYMSLDQYDTVRETEGFGGKYKYNYRHTMPLNNRVLKFYNSSPRRVIDRLFFVLLTIWWFL